jgi:hypothetical protein
MSIKPLYALTLAAIFGCAPPPGAAGGAPQRSALLTADEIAASDAEGKTAYDMVSRLRPSWLRARGVRPRLPDTPTDSSEFALVVVGRGPIGRIQALRDIQANHVAELRYYDPTEGTGSYGERGGSGVIQVTMKAPNRR